MDTWIHFTLKKKWKVSKYDTLTVEVTMYKVNFYSVRLKGSWNAF
jgi:hypothetical protein